MRTQISQKMRHGFTLIEILIVVVILGILAAIVIPQFTDAAGEASRSNLQTQLQTLRSQIELYNVQNPADAYDALTAVAGFWDPLIQGNYLQTWPKNPLQNNSTSVATAAAADVGWVWNTIGGDAWTLNIYTVDEDGNMFDGDGDGQPD